MGVTCRRTVLREQEVPSYGGQTTNTSTKNTDSYETYRQSEYLLHRILLCHQQHHSFAPPPANNNLNDWQLLALSCPTHSKGIDSKKIIYLTNGGVT